MNAKRATPQAQVPAPVQPSQEAPKPAEFDAPAYIKEKGSKSAAIRALSAEGKSRSEIKNLLGIKYQHVRNVLITPVKKAQQ